jgi:ketosteroid isomerase-like protein
MRIVLLTLALTFTTPPHPPAFEELADAERAFAARAQEVSVLQAFMEYFADDAVGFETGQPASAQAEMRKQQVKPRDPNLLFWWEPRHGDIAASGDLGWLTGPARFGRRDAEPSKVRHGNYASIWKRQSDGRFKVIIDIGSDPPGEVPFAPGLTRMPFANRYVGAEIAPLARVSLLAADRALNAAARTSPSTAFEKAAAPAIRVHRNGRLPLEGREAVVAWLATQPGHTSAESLYAETAASSDLGYTFGSHERGHYVRVWVREASGSWRVALDLEAPRPSRP